MVLDTALLNTQQYKVHFKGKVDQSRELLFIFEAKQQPMYHACQTKYTLKHILIECTDLTHIRETFYSANDMKELF